MDREIQLVDKSVSVLGADSLQGIHTEIGGDTEIGNKELEIRKSRIMTKKFSESKSFTNLTIKYLLQNSN